MIYDKLYDWQKKVVDSYESRDAFGLFLDCGLGKTPISMAFAEVNKCTKVIVVTINSKAIEDDRVNGSWWQWAERSEITYRIKNKNKIKDLSDCDLLIINYESLFKRGKDLKRRVELRDQIVNFIKNCRGHNLAILVDESHKMKNLQSLQTESIMAMQRLGKIYANKCYTYLLTGTPFTVGFIDLYSQLKALGCDLTKGAFVEAFCIKDCIPGLLGWQQPIIGYKNVNLLYDLVHRYAITVKSNEVLTLPDQVFVNHITPQTQSFKLFSREKLPSIQINEELRKRGLPQEEPDSNKKIVNPFYRNIDYPDLDYLAATAGNEWLRARQLSVGFQGNAERCVWYDKSRLTELERLLEQNEDNYVLFYNYTPELLELYDLCERLGYNIDVYCGEVKSLVYYEKYCAMSESDKLVSKKNIIIANFASGSTGMNWQEYSQCIIFSLPLYKDWEQGLKRVHRIGQKSTVVYHVFFQDNWLDHGMKRALDEKITYSEEMFKDGLRKENELWKRLTVQNIKYPPSERS